MSKLLQRVYRGFRNGFSKGEDILYRSRLILPISPWHLVGQGLTGLFHQHPSGAARDEVASKLYLFCQRSNPSRKLQRAPSDLGHKLGQTVFVVEQIGSIKIARLFSKSCLTVFRLCPSLSNIIFKFRRRFSF